MPEPANTLLIEGSFEELAEELAQYLAQLKKPAAEDGSSVHADVVRLLEQNQKDEVLKKLVTASVLLTAAPERGADVFFFWFCIYMCALISRPVPDSTNKEWPVMIHTYCTVY